MAEDLAELCSTLGLKSELTSNECRYLTKEILAKEGEDLFLLAAYSKM